MVKVVVAVVIAGVVRAVTTARNSPSNLLQAKRARSIIVNDDYVKLVATKTVCWSPFSGRLQSALKSGRITIRTLSGLSIHTHTHTHVKTLENPDCLTCVAHVFFVANGRATGANNERLTYVT